MNTEERIANLEVRLDQLKQQVNIIGNQLAKERERTKQLETEVNILKEGGNL